MERFSEDVAAEQIERVITELAAAGYSRVAARLSMGRPRIVYERAALREMHERLATTDTAFIEPGPSPAPMFPPADLRPRPPTKGESARRLGSEPERSVPPEWAKLVNVPGLGKPANYEQAYWRRQAIADLLLLAAARATVAGQNAPAAIAAARAALEPFGGWPYSPPTTDQIKAWRAVQADEDDLAAEGWIGTIGRAGDENMQRRAVHMLPEIAPWPWEPEKDEEGRFAWLDGSLPVQLDAVADAVVDAVKVWACREAASVSVERDDEGVAINVDDVDVLGVFDGMQRITVEYEPASPGHRDHLHIAFVDGKRGYHLFSVDLDDEQVKRLDDAFGGDADEAAVLAAITEEAFADPETFADLAEAALRFEIADADDYKLPYDVANDLAFQASLFIVQAEDTQGLRLAVARSVGANAGTRDARDATTRAVARARAALTKHADKLFNKASAGHF
jgi:hypothetical protein